MLKQLLNNIGTDNLVESKSGFDSIMLEKVQSILESKRKEVSKKLYNKDSDECCSEEIDLEHFTEEELSELADQFLDEKYEGFEKLKGELAAKGAKDPAALAAYIGRKKYGKAKFQKAAATGHKLN